MAFDVTPTGGANEYEFTASFLNEYSFNLGFTLRFLNSSASVGVCPPPSNAQSLVSGAAEDLLATGVYIRSNVAIPAGSCTTYKIEVLDPSNEIIDMQYVNISNI